MAEALRQGAGHVFPGVSSGKSNGTLEPDNTGCAFSMTVKSVNPDTSVEDQAALRTNGGPDGIDSVDVNNRKGVQVQVQVQVHKGAEDSSLSGNLSTMNSENRTFKADFDSNVVKSEKKNREIKALGLEIKELQHSLESKLHVFFSDAKKTPLELEECYKKIASGCEKMKAEYQSCQDKLVALAEVAKELGEIKPKKLKVFVEKLKSLNRISDETYDGEDFSVCNAQILECSPQERNKQYMTLVGQFVNFLDACPSMLDNIVSINNYFSDNSLKENDDNSSVKAGGLDDEMGCLLNKREWLSVLCSLAQEFSKLKQWEGQVDYFVENIEVVKGIVKWVVDQSDEDVAVSLLGHLLGEQIEVITERTRALDGVAGERLRIIKHLDEKLDKCLGPDAKIREKKIKVVHMFSSHSRTTELKDSKRRESFKKTSSILKKPKIRESFKKLEEFLTFMDTGLHKLCKGVAKDFTMSVPEQPSDINDPPPEATDQSSVETRGMVLKTEKRSIPLDSGSERKASVFSDHCDLIRSVGDVKDLVFEFLGEDEQLKDKFYPDYAAQQDRQQLVLNEYRRFSELAQLLENENKGIELEKIMSDFSSRWSEFKPAFKYLSNMSVQGLDEMTARLQKYIGSNTNHVKPEVFYDSYRSSYLISPEKANEITKKKPSNSNKSS